MNEFISQLVGKFDVLGTSDAPMRAYGDATKEAHRIGKTPVEQEFPGLLALGINSHFLMPTATFYHAPSGYILYASLALFPGMCNLGPNWLSLPIVVRYTATQRFSEATAVDAIRATLLQSCQLPAAGRVHVSGHEFLHKMTVLFASAAEAHEVQEGIFESYALLCLEVEQAVLQNAVDSIKSIAARFSS